MLELNKTTIPVKIYGQAFELRPVTVKERELFSKIGDSSDQKVMIENSMELLKSVGLSQEIVEQLELDHMAQIITYISESSKKK